MKVIKLTLKKVDFCGISALDELTFADQPDRYSRYGFGAIPDGMEGRQETGGPKVPGPWAFAFGLSSCIDAHGITARKEAALQAAGLLHEGVEVGDLLAFGEAPCFVYVGFKRHRGPQFRPATHLDWQAASKAGLT